MQRRNKKYALENLAPYIRLLVQAADKIIKIIPLFWDRRRIVAIATEDLSSLPRVRGFVKVWVAIRKTQQPCPVLTGDALPTMRLSQNRAIIENPLTGWTSQGKNKCLEF